VLPLLSKFPEKLIPVSPEIERSWCFCKKGYKQVDLVSERFKKCFDDMEKIALNEMKEN
jgi:hypothetical protein